MIDSSKDIISKWLKGIPYEVAFWNNVYRWNATFKGMMGWANYGSTISLEDFDANRFLLQKEHPVALDVGAGMSYATGNFTSKNGQNLPLDIHYVDPLAFHYNKILRRYRKSLPEIEFGMMEYLSAFFPQKNVSLIMIQNALDHSANPMKGIWEALASLHIGGVLNLNHHPNEAETERYKGFHQFNIIDENGRLIIWNKQQRIDVNTLIQKYANITVSRNTTSGHVIAVMCKTAEIPQEMTCDKTDKQFLCNLLMMQNLQQFSLRHTLSYHLNYWKFNTIQFFIQALPWEWKMKLKKILHR